MEYIDIVDEEGNLTGEVVLRNVVDEKKLLHKEVGCFILNNKGEVLLEKRSPNKFFNPNKYSIVAGHVEVGESEDEAVIRELKEELGIDIDLGHLYKLEGEPVLRYNCHFTYFYYIFCDKNEDEFILQEEEVASVKWFSIDEVVELLKNNDFRFSWKEDKAYLFELLKNVDRGEEI